MVGRSDLVEGGRQDRELVRREWIGEVCRDRADVAWRGPLQKMPAARREDDVKSATVGGAGLSLHETVVLEAVDRARHAALREERAQGEVSRTDPCLGTPGDLHKKKVLTKGHASSAVCQALKRVGRGRIGAQE